MFAEVSLHLCLYTYWHVYDICSSNLPFPALLRVLSALAHWAAIFGEVDYLPLVAFPFVKLFQNNPLLCFEMLATVIGTQQMIAIAKKDLSMICSVACCIIMLRSVCGSSKLVSTLVRVLSQPTFEYLGHGGECSGSSWQEAAAAPGELWHHLPSVCVAPPGDSVLRGFDPWWVAPALWLGLLQSPVILAHGLCGLHHLLPPAVAEILPKARFWGNVPLTFGGKRFKNSQSLVSTS